MRKETIHSFQVYDESMTGKDQKIGD